MATRTDEPVPPSQLFRALLLHFLETHKILIPIVAHTPNKELKWCHQQNAYILSEIGSYLADLIEATDLTPSFSAAQSAELLAGVASTLQASGRPIAPSSPPAPTVLQALPPGIRRAASSRRRVLYATGMGSEFDWANTFPPAILEREARLHLAYPLDAWITRTNRGWVQPDLLDNLEP